MTLPFTRLLAAALLAAALLPAAAAVNRDQAAAAAQRESGGRVLSVDRADANGRSVWRVKVVTKNGDVRVFLVDADSGQVQ
ncbi:PepSY domain-containing protein [Caenimonas sedimenti]|uniref:PepSY domain-containing protein n=1 Tax=Caenimonas sedimenti TaxID=2596921 RepID=A0A562ZMB5_9BURK|nr:PepSY domain-containing protein [Caenimonas sedimenti]TWO69465.1 PepSY domain-containing protein [Caenimonas sedimenti]